MSTDGDDTDASDDDEAGVFDYDPEWSEFLDQGMMCARSGDVEGFAHAIDALRQLRDDFDEWARGYGMPYFSWMATAARAGQVEIMQLIVAMDMCVMDHWIMACLARNGHVHVLEWALEHGLGLGVDIICEEAARRGRVNVLKFARLDHDCHWDENTPRLAALGGHSQCLKFAYKNGCRFNAEVTRAAVRGGKLNCLRYLHEVVKCPWDEGSCIAAAEAGHLDCLQYLHKHGCECSEATFTAAARVGQLETLKYLHANDCPYSSQASIAAAENGHLEALKFLHEHGYVFSPDVSKIAARFDLDCVRYLVETLGYDITRVEVVEMMRYGSLDCLEYAFENVGDIFREHGASLCLYAASEGQEISLKFIIERVGAPKEWISSTCAIAAHEGHLTCLEYLHKHGCPMDEQVSCSAAVRGQLECLKFAMKHTKPVYEILESAARNGHLDCLRYGYMNYCPLEEGLLNAAAENVIDDIDCIRYLALTGLAWDEETCIRAARVGNVAVLRCLHENGCPWDTRLLATDSEACRNYAIENGVLGDIEHVLRGNFSPTRIAEHLLEAMRVIDDVKTSIPEGKYLEICSALQSAFSEIRKLE